MGGNVYKDEVVPVDRDDIEFILRSLYVNIFPYYSILEVIGGGLIKEESGDLDIVVKFPKESHKDIKEYFKDYESKRVGAVISVKYPWKGKFIQLDIEETDNIKYSIWRKRTHTDEKYTGQTRGILLDTMVKYSDITNIDEMVMERWLLSPISGLCRVVFNNGKEHYRFSYTKDAKEIVNTITSKFIKNLPEDVFDTTQSIIETVETHFPKDIKETIFTSVVQQYRKREVVIPDELYKYIKDDV